MHVLRRGPALPRGRLRLSLVPRDALRARAVATVLPRRALAVPPVDPDPETRRRARVQSPAVGFVGGILVLAALLAVVALVLWAVL